MVMNSNLNKTAAIEYNMSESFEEMFKEYKQSVLLFRVFFIVSILFFALAIVFTVVFLPVSLFLISISFFSYQISKIQLFIANHSEQFIIGKL